MSEAYKQSPKKCTMRFLIIAAIIACAATAPAPEPIAPVAIAPARPTISAGDINGAAIEAQVEVSDNLRAAVDAEQQLIDQANELRDRENEQRDQVAEQQGQAANQAEENAWRAVDNVKTIEAVLDGQAAREAPVIAKNLVRSSVVPGINAPVAPRSVSSPIVPKVSRSVTIEPQPVAYASSPVGFIAAPVGYPPAPVRYTSAPVGYTSAPVGYTAAPVRFAPAPIEYSRAFSYPIEYTQHLAYDHIW